MSQPIAFKTIRYRCPHCPRTGSSKARVADHIGRCWTNPAARGCKTCANYEGPGDACGCEPGCNWGGPAGGYPEHCRAGVNLAGRPECPACGGHGWKGISVGAEIPCNSEVTIGHVGDGKAVKPGPIVHCDRWEVATDA
ncbi:hypothetical protein OHA21_43745 [Actinoplanes sp. NBC_00393]|uniref:hypothetical protein n=1 Tax=Actinoplanes sp. NBC_00393 TaxID=2975953 RepID=UPI002E202ABD